MLTVFGKKKKKKVAVTMYGNFIGRKNFSCDLHLWFTTLMIPLGGGAIVARLALVSNRARYNRFLYRVGSQLEELRDKDSSPNPCSVFAAFFCSPSLGDLSHQKRFSADLPQNDMPVDPNRTYALFYRTKRRFGYFVVAVFTLMGVIGILVNYITRPDVFGKGCLGCRATWTALAVYGILLLAIACAGIYELWGVRNESDPLRLIREIKLLLSCLLLIFSGLFLAAIDYGDVRRNGEFDWLYFSVAAATLMHTVHCPIQVFATYRVGDDDQSPPAAPHNKNSSSSSSRSIYGASFRRSNVDSLSRSVPSEDSASDSGSVTVPSKSVRMDSQYMSVEKLLSNKAGRRIFKKYLVTEYAVENIYFLDAVERFEQNYLNFSAQETAARAYDIYNSFVKEQSMLQVNISSTARDGIKRKLIKPTMRNGSRPPKDLFSVACEQVRHLLATDSYPRFLKSKYCEEWMMPSLAV